LRAGHLFQDAITRNDAEKRGFLCAIGAQKALLQGRFSAFQVA